MVLRYTEDEIFLHFPPRWTIGRCHCFTLPGLIVINRLVLDPKKEFFLSREHPDPAGCKHTHTVRPRPGPVPGKNHFRSSAITKLIDLQGRWGSIQ